MVEYEIKSGNESAALAVLHSGVNSAYAYPGTPSTEILTDLIKKMDNAHWCANEKTALESALGVSFNGRRSFVAMKHVGLNVAADPFLSGANMDINGGIVIVVADDPGMHSSQNEQDTRYYADFARTICLEPSDVQETYDMIRDGFELSEKFHKIVVIRMCTRLSHSKGKLFTKEPASNICEKPISDAKKWNVVPAFGKKMWQRVIDEYPQLLECSENIKYNYEEKNDSKIGIITTGLAKQYYKETNLNFSHLHIGFYPFPQEKIKNFAENLDEIYVLEEGYPFIEKYLKGILPTKQKIYGKIDGTFNLVGELSPETVNKGLKINNEYENVSVELENIPNRPPQLCKGCPHADTFNFIGEVYKKQPDLVLNADIGCYSLGSLPPFNLPITLVDMGASIGMAKGAADCGKKSIAVIGDSTFIHSGLTGLVDCISNSTPIVIIILDNSVTAMTGGQPQILPSAALPEIVKAAGVLPEHIHTIVPLANQHEKNVEILEQELNYNGVSVIISKRECIEALRKSLKKEAK